MKRNKGITLIALIVTIIVLLILAGITLNMVMGDSGIFKKANTASEETNKSQALEELRLKVLEVQSKEEGKATLKQVLEFLKLDDQYEYILYGETASINGDISSISENPEQIYIGFKGYKFKIDNKLIVTFADEESDTIDEADNPENLEKIPKLGYIEDGLVVLYDGKKNTRNGHNETSTIWENLVDDANNGILKNIDFTSESGWTSNSLIIDGIDDWVQMTDLYNENMTIEICAKPLNYNDTIAYYISNFEYGGIGIIKSDTNKNQSMISVSGYKNIETSKELIPNQIYSLSTGYDGKKIYFSENGEITSEENKSGKIDKQSSDTIFAIGANPSGNGVESSQDFNMEVYSVRIYNRCLTEEEVTKNYEIDKKRFNLIQFEKNENSGYVEEGLICLLDGKNNMRYGRNNITTKWYNLVGNDNADIFGIDKNSTSGWTNNSLILDGVDDWVRLNGEYFNNKYMTIEICAKPLKIDSLHFLFLDNLESGGISIEKAKNNNIFSRIHINGSYRSLQIINGKIKLPFLNK